MYGDGYVIRAVDTLRNDTLNIISVKDTIRNKGDYKKMVVGNFYTFEYADVLEQMSAMPPNSFVIKIRNTVLWRDGDPIKAAPVFSRNTKGDCIRKD